MHSSSRHAVAACAFAVVFMATRALSAHTENDPASASESFAWADTFEPATETADEASPTPRPRHEDKRFVIARDFGLAIPVGPFADQAAVMYGPLLRLGYHPNDAVEIGIRAGYQRGFDRTVDGVTGSLSSVPIYTSARWFARGHRAGPYVGGEIGANLFRQNRTARTSFWDVSADRTWVRPAADIGVGWVWSRALPIDVRVQLASLDLVSRHGPLDDLTFGVNAGYSSFF